MSPMTEQEKKDCVLGARLRSAVKMLQESSFNNFPQPTVDEAVQSFVTDELGCAMYWWVATGQEDLPDNDKPFPGDPRVA